MPLTSSPWETPPRFLIRLHTDSAPRFGADELVTLALGPTAHRAHLGCLTTSVRPQRRHGEGPQTFTKRNDPGRLVAGGAVRVSGAGHQLTGGVTYGTQFSNSGAGNTINPPPIKGNPISAAPVDFAAWLPDGPIAKANGAAAYTNVSTNCVGSGAARVWAPSATLPPGVYYADCRINITGVNRVYNATFVSTIDIVVSGSGLNITGYTANVSLFGKTGITISGAAISTSGQIQSLGPVLISGAGGVHRSGVLATTLTLAGAGTRLEP